MKKSIFFSWQSDLPNATNRGFIEDSLNIATKNIKAESIHLDVAIDRDTKNVAGTPDIVSTIFSKIDKVSIFVADISIINADYEGRKTPNPNVLVELGYAAKTIGWDNIICVFNKDHGKFEDLPFDLRFRRPLTYQIDNPSNKSKDRLKLAKDFEYAISSILHAESAKDEIRNYIKQQVDKEILTICNHLFKIFYGYNKQYSLDEIWRMLSLTSEQIQIELYERTFLGFIVLKDWRNYMVKIEAIMNQPFFNQNAEPKYVSALIKVVRALEAMAIVYSDNQLFQDTEDKAIGYRVVHGRQMNPENPVDEYLLLREINNEEKGIVIDFGTIRKYNIPRLLNYQSIGGESFIKWSISIEEIIRSIEGWVDNTGNHLLLDPLTFRV